MPKHTMIILHEVYDENDMEMEELEYEVTFDFYAYTIPARRTGHPDNWTPADGDSDWDIEKVTLGEDEIEWEDLDEDVKTKINTEVEEWVNKNGEEACEDDVDYEPDYDDYDDLPNDFVPAGYDPYGGP